MVSRRKFIRRGALLVPAAFAFPAIVRAQSPVLQHRRTVSRPSTSAPASTVIEFSGASDQRIDGFSVATSITTFSISFWFYPIPSSNNYGTILTQGASAGLWYRGGSLKMDVYSGGDQLNTTALTENAWTHMTLSVATGVGTFYKGGSSDGTFVAAAFTFSNIGTDTSSNHFKGRLGQMAVYSIALSGTQAANLANKSTTPDAIGSLLAYWKLDDVADGASGNGVTFADSSGNGKQGTGSGTTGRTATF